MLSVPPPVLGATGDGGTAGAVVSMVNTVVCVIFCPDIAAANTEFGLSTIAWVMLGGMGFGNRKLEETARLASLKGGNATAVLTGGVPPIGNGRMLTGSIAGPSATLDAIPRGVHCRAMRNRRHAYNCRLFGRIAGGRDSHPKSRFHMNALAGGRVLYLLQIVNSSQFYVRLK